MREVDESARPVMSMPNAQKPGILAMAVAPRERKISRDQMQVAVTAFLVLRRLRLFSGRRSQVQTATVEVDRMNKILFVSESSSCVFHSLDLRVEGFAGSVRNLMP